MNFVSTSEYDILIILVAILLLTLVVRRLQLRVESLYQNHLSLSGHVYMRPTTSESVGE